MKYLLLTFLFACSKNKTETESNEANGLTETTTETTQEVVPENLTSDLSTSDPSFYLSQTSSNTGECNQTEGQVSNTSTSTTDGSVQTLTKECVESKKENTNTNTNTNSGSTTSQTDESEID